MLAPDVARIADELRRAVPTHPEMVFHLLWSRVMDEMWCTTWRMEGRPNCPPRTDWVIYPHSRFEVGTNYWEADYAITWNRRAECPMNDAVSHARLLLLKAAWGQAAAGPALPALRSVGLLNDVGRFRGFAYHAHGSLDTLVDRLTREYAAMVTRAYDYDSLSRKLGIPVDQLWVVLLHETAYAVFENLAASGSLAPPAVLMGKGDLHDCRTLVSFRLDKPLGPEDDIAQLFQDSGWVGNRATVEACERLLAANPNDSVANYYLGLSLYHLGDDQHALEVFTHLRDTTNDDRERERHLLARLWMGHMYDLLGRRDDAIKEYEAIITSAPADMRINYSGYQIGPTTVREWVSDRLRRPFTRR